MPMVQNHFMIYVCFAGRHLFTVDNVLWPEQDKIYGLLKERFKAEEGYGVRMVNVCYGEDVK